MNTGLVNAAPKTNAPLMEGLTRKYLGTSLDFIQQTTLDPQDQTTIEPDPTIQSIINQIDTTNVYSLTGDLTGEWPVTIGGDSYIIRTRATRYITATEQVTQFAYEHFESFGLNVAYHYYDHLFYGERRNIIAEQIGVGQPERILIMTAHIDNAPTSPIAPGADDNASGSVAVLLAAELLSQYEFDCTLRYALFTGEEQGLHGSYDYAQDAYAAGENIEAVLNLDMIAYESDGQPILDLHTRPINKGDLRIAGTFLDVVSAYNLALIPQIHQDGIGRSDHVSFWQVGYPAILAIEDDDDFTPYYHTTEDKLETLNLNYFTDFVRAALGTLSHLGCMLGTVSGSVQDVGSGLPLSGVKIEALKDGNVIEGTTSDHNGNYALDLVLDNYTLKASHPGYIPYSFADIAIQGALTTTIDFHLEAYEPIPSADFVFQPHPAQTGEPVVFTGTVSGGTPPIAYAWNFGDGNQGTGQVVEHIFGLNDTYTVVMTATNGAGSITATHDVEVEGSCLPIEGLDFSYTPTEPMIDDVIYFTASVSAGTHPIFYDWDFGDGTIRSGGVVTHAFPSNLAMESYKVTLTGDNLCTSPQSVDEMIILQPYQAFFPLLTNDAP